MAKLFGRTEPRLWTRPLRPLTAETSRGFEVIEFARDILGVTLYPWQEWLLIHALEVMPDGQYRFKRVIVLVARQQGKTTLASVLAAWWLYVDSKRHPEHVPPLKFKVVGVAQNLDIAREPWKSVKLWSDPQPETEAEAELAIGDLQSATARVSDTNGKESIVARNLAHYEIRAAKNARGKPAARLLLDELREQGTWDAWNAVSQTLKAFWSGQLWGISNAGDVGAVVLRAQRDAALALLQSWQDLVDKGVMDAEEWANGNDVSLGLFEWSAPDGCDMDDVDGILQANPSIGYGAMTVQSALADMPPSMEESGYRTEVLCQWVTSRATPFLNPNAWGRGADIESAVPEASRQVLGVSTAGNRSMTTIGVAGIRADELIHLELLRQREGMLWVVDYLKQVREKTGISEVAVQASGCPAADFIKPLTDAGFVVHEIRQTALLNAAGRLHDRVRDGLVRHRDDPTLNLTAANGTARYISKMPVWDLFDSPVDVAPMACLTDALYALEELAPPPPKPIPAPPPRAAAVARDEATPSDANLAVIDF